MDGGQIRITHSISAGLDYAGIGPEHSYLRDPGRVEYTSVNDKDALSGFTLLSEVEGIIPALEPAHAVSYAKKILPHMGKDKIVILNLSGRGDKDIDIVKAYLNE